MRLTPAQAQAVASGRKLTHRLLVSEGRVWQRARRIDGEKRTYGPTQQTSPWQPYIGERITITAGERHPETREPLPPVCHVVLTGDLNPDRKRTHVDETTLRELTRDQAKTEGYVGPLHFKRDWLVRHDKGWTAKQRATDEGLTDDAVSARFHARHIGTPIYILHLQVCEGPDHYLAVAAGTTLDPKRSIDPDAPFVNPDPQYVKRAAELAEQQRASFRRDLEQERARQKAERVPKLRAHARRRRDAA